MRDIETYFVILLFVAGLMVLRKLEQIFEVLRNLLGEVKRFQTRE